MLILNIKNQQFGSRTNILRLSLGSCMLSLRLRLSIGSCVLSLRLRVSFRGS